MSNLPLREISISDFRRLADHRTLPLDAPVVLLHGPNGTGKTSVLSALELALTGEVRSMRRHDKRYTAHLPTRGHSFATVRAEVGQGFAVGEPHGNTTVGGDRIEGQPALSASAAQFYAERCYLDQVSLGQLLDLYQYRSGKEESALARFVNELLGLDQLDALRSGLADATDVRRMRKLSEGFAEAEASAEEATEQLRQVTTHLEQARTDLAVQLQDLLSSLGELGHSPPVTGSPGFDVEVERLLQSDGVSDEQRQVQGLESLLTALGGRIAGLASQPSTVRLVEAKEQAAGARAAIHQWRAEHGATIAEWRNAVAALQIDSGSDPQASLDEELRRLDSRLTLHEASITEVEMLQQRIATHYESLDAAQVELARAQEQAGSLAAALATLREHVSDSVCPVCDRDFEELGRGHLSDHLDRKIAELTDLGRQIQELTMRREAVGDALAKDQRALTALRAQVLSDEELEVAAARRGDVQALLDRLIELRPVISEGEDYAERSRRAENELEDIQGGHLEEQAVRGELDGAARVLNVAAPTHEEPLEEAWQRMAGAAAVRSSDLRARSAALEKASESLANLRRCAEQVTRLQADVAVAAEKNLGCDQRLAEAKRRQAVAREVHAAANSARSAIVQQVFTKSLNDVWQSVFSRLAPREPWIPAFGIPTSTRTSLDLRLETVHSSGETGGSPQMMLSAGNLNTAALSLFIALHLAVEPVVPCLVFDDPVQSMDEVHVAQFAGLIRVLSKNHGRQVVVAVHERELFEYLTLELSPAYDGDELITIELGERANDEDGGVTRFRWSPDAALAV